VQTSQEDKGFADKELPILIEKGLLYGKRSEPTSPQPLWWAGRDSDSRPTPLMIVLMTLKEALTRRGQPIEALYQKF
jgi:hypothetical protein